MNPCAAVRTAALVLALAISSTAQPAAGKPPAFEVASVKTSHTEDPRRAGVEYLPGGHLRIENLPLFPIIAFAYDLPFNPSIRLSGGPDWIRTERFDIDARAGRESIPAGMVGKARIQKMKAMLQTLLADRFQMTIRAETRELPVYAVVVARNGPKLRAATIQEKDCPADDGNASGQGSARSAVRCHAFTGGQGRGLHGKAVDMSDLAGYVENWTDRPVVEKTGLTGLFEIESDGWAPMVTPPGPPREAGPGDEGMSDPTRPSIFMIFDRLGLKLEMRKAPVRVYVIDRVERLSEN